MPEANINNREVWRKIWEGGSTPNNQEDRKKKTARRRKENDQKKVSKIKQKMKLEPEKVIEKKHPEKKGLEISKIRKLFEPEKEQITDKNVRKTIRRDDSWVKNELGCDKMKAAPVVRKRKPELDCKVEDRIECNDEKRRRNYQQQTWEGWREETGAV